MEAKKKNEYATVKPVSSFDDWFAKNGRPNYLHEPQYKYDLPVAPTFDSLASHHLLPLDRWASTLVPSKKFCNPHGIDEKTGTQTIKPIPVELRRSKSVTMLRGRLAAGK